MTNEFDFKYFDWKCIPDSTTIIEPCNKKKKYAVKFDIANDASLSLYNFSNAYYKTAHIIATRMISKKQIDELDQYVFPLFFLYRHSLELLLKSIGFKFIIDKSQRQIFLSETFHNLKNILEYILRHTTFSRNIAEYQWLTKYFDNISEADKASDSFRYPFHIIFAFDELGCREFEVKRVFQKQTHLDLISEANKFEAAYEILNAWYLDINDPEIEHKATEYTECRNTFLDEGGDYYAQSVVGYEYRHNDFYAYCSGYKECASYMLEYLRNQYDAGIDLDYSHMWYPMCYLYRNSVELLLKSILFEYSNQSWQTKCAVAYDNKHKLCQLLINAEKNAIDYYEIEDRDDYIKNMVRYCRILHDFDTDSSKFRYPIDKRCNPYLSTIRYYNFVDIGMFLKALVSAIDGIHSEIDYRKDVIDTLRAEYSGY